MFTHEHGGVSRRVTLLADREYLVSNRLIVRGAREHNLKDVHLDLPRDAMIAFTGLSGSGKSSLAFDTIFAEGQRRYVESLSAYARQFIGQLDKPDVDAIEGLSPAVAIDQRTTSGNPRSTVGTITEIYDDLRHSIDHDELTVHYQPIARVSDGEIVSAEALVGISLGRLGMARAPGRVPSGEPTVSH